MLHPISEPALIREKLTGIVVSIRTPFTQNGEVDYDAFPRVLEAGLRGGSKCLLLTAGDSHFDCLTDDEIKEVTRLVCDFGKQRDVLVVAADRNHTTKQAIAFAEFARSCGADVIMPLPPDWAQSITPETFANHWLEISKVMPVMAVTNRFRDKPLHFGLSAIRLALDKGANLCSIKEDVGGILAQRMAFDFGSLLPVFAGGPHRLHLDMHAYGASGFMAPFGAICPSFGKNYLAAINENRLHDAARMVVEVEASLFQAAAQVSGGWNAAFHGLYELAGLCYRWRRPPYASIGDAELKALREVATRLGLLK